MNLLEHARALLGVAEPRPPWPPARLSLALQGGGSFGAFTWGVLDRLLEEPAIAIESVSGASAGAVNGALLASGLVRGGRAGARERLERFWRRMTDEAAFLSLATIPGLSAGGPLSLLTRAFTPAQFNPFDLNPLRSALAAEVDFEALRDPAAPRLLVATTRVRDGALRLFRNAEMSVDVVLASACVPVIHRSVEIEGEAYWDGAYAANPPILPLVHECDMRDLLVVQITPSKDRRAPTTTGEIGRRLDQITFNATLNTEIAALELAKRLGATPKLKALRIARIAAEDEIDGLSERSAADLGRTFIETLHTSGRRAATRWLAHPAALHKAA